ncbi:MAG: membrane dipeptidase [Phycisphaerales bacterium]|nr:membrane dipeptidase [Phycisphaerales bacterium]
MSESASNDMRWFDAHLDLACLALNKRDMQLPLAQIKGDPLLQGPWPPPAVTLPSLRDGGVRCALATIFTEADGDGPEGYGRDDVNGARNAGLAQLETYKHWADLDLIGIAHRGRFDRALPPDHPGLRTGILIECADPIATPDDLAWWRDQGVVAVGLAWSRGSRYASGNGASRDDDRGLMPMGVAMVDAIDSLRMVHDLSHLSLRAMDDVLARAKGPVMASHSNCRALLGGDANPHAPRHLDDATIKEVGKRDGVIGLNLARNFIRHGLQGDERPNVAEAIDHVERICELTGSRRHVGLGSDMDGGFSANDMPAAIDAPSDLIALSDELRRRGWDDDEVRGFECGNWLRFWSEQR